MKQITLDCRGMTDKNQLHAALAQTLEFPDWYGSNLDALYDCLTDLTDPVQLQLTGWSSLPDWKAAFEVVFQDAENDCDEFFVIFA